MAPPEVKRPRPTKYTPELGLIICEGLAEGRTLRAICRDDTNLPDERTVRRWAIDPEHPFAPQYAHARLVGYHSMADEIVEISDDARNDWMVRLDKDGAGVGWQLNGDHFQRSRLRVETRKWLLSKALPKVYGDKLAHEHTGKDGGPIEMSDQPQATGDDHLADLTRRYAGKARPQNEKNGAVH